MYDNITFCVLMRTLINNNLYQSADLRLFIFETVYILVSNSNSIVWLVVTFFFDL